MYVKVRKRTIRVHKRLMYENEMGTRIFFYFSPLYSGQKDLFNSLVPRLSGEKEPDWFFFPRRMSRFNTRVHDTVSRTHRSASHDDVIDIIKRFRYTVPHLYTYERGMNYHNNIVMGIRGVAMYTSYTTRTRFRFRSDASKETKKTFCTECVRGIMIYTRV